MMHDEIGPLTFPERLARLEERSEQIVPMLDEIRAEQKAMAAQMAHAIGGFRALMLLGAFVALFGTVRHLTAWAGSAFRGVAP